ncbi:hypothetical protein NW754_006711 [Fusarium falciforme]|uniref:Uncharacterized protein n=1 Tax=Fusarium falciforme TaxID=195108 RepID=A0A9W8V5G5_9HYPO|nr:hypothetical protein NW754_006711 [Fusarium falciforme]KAJ4197630.1 hypothetical protein NW755_000325 [Fusarium falciforme]KAJ4262528.1 hypothetical protein NW757_000787 [Fusarium falciforme]
MLRVPSPAQPLVGAHRGPPPMIHGPPAKRVPPTVKASGLELLKAIQSNHVSGFCQSPPPDFPRRLTSPCRASTLATFAPAVSWPFRPFASTLFAVQAGESTCP